MPTTTRVRLADVLVSLSLATDLGQGQAEGWEVRSAVVALALADRLGLDADERRAVWDLSLLRYIGCTSHATEVAELFGDDVAARRDLLGFDLADTRAMGGYLVRHVASDAPFARRLRAVASALAAGPRGAAAGFRASCQVATAFATRLGFEPSTVDALRCGFERFDGKGLPDGVAGEAIPRSMRVVQVAQDGEALCRRDGVESGAATIGSRAGSMYDPAAAAEFAAHAAELLAAVDDDPHAAVLAAEPAPPRWLEGDAVDHALLVVADYADLKSTWFLGHSRSVADLAAAGAEAAGMPAVDVATARRAGLVHDLGRAAVANTVWDHPGPLTMAATEQARLHAHWTDRLVGRVAGLDAVHEVAAATHERVDGSGYAHGLRGTAVLRLAQVVAAADEYVAMVSARPHRPALEPDAAARELRRAATDGRLGTDVVEAVLGAAGHRTRRQTSAGALTPREIEVLRSLARGATVKGIAAELGMSPKTAGHHVESIYAKAGVSTRGAAALYSIQHGYLSA